MKGQARRSNDDRAFRRDLRRNATDVEKHLWRRLRGGPLAGVKFRRQHPFLGYVLDFVSLEKDLVIEVDGSQHLGSEQDHLRDRQLRAAGFRVLRFWNHQVLQETDAVVATIWRELVESTPSLPIQPHPHPGPPLEGEGEIPSETCQWRAGHPGRPLEGEGRGGR